MKFHGLTGRWRRIAQAVLVAVVTSASGMAAAADTSPPKDHAIGYVLTHLYWSMYQSKDGKEECAKGLNEGPREQYAKTVRSLGKQYTVQDAQLKLETRTWLPADVPAGFTFHEVTGKRAFGMNLDGKAGPNDFTSPDGEQGIDNQLYRALGCIIGFRGPDGVEFVFENLAIADYGYNRLMIELTGVDSLENDPEAEVSVFRGLDRLLTDATGNTVMPGGSQRVDTRWGAKLFRKVKGRIVNGVLATDPIPDLVIPWMNLSVPTVQRIRDARLRLNVSSTAAEGLIAGYADVDTWYKQLIRNDSTHHLGDGQISAISLRQALRRLADAYPDPATGESTAISSSLDAKFVQVFINRDGKPESVSAQSGSAASSSRR